MGNGEIPQFEPQSIPAGSRRATQASTLLLHEWAKMQPWDLPPIYELRLGPTTQNVPGIQLTPAIEAMLRRANWYADLVGMVGHELWVVEAKVVATPAAVGQLEFYRTLITSTPELGQWRDRLIVPILLVAVDDDAVHQFALGKGIRVEQFAPAWVENYLVQKHFRRRQINRVQASIDEAEAGAGQTEE